MNKSLSQYVNYTVGQYLFDVDDIVHSSSGYYSNIYERIMGKRNHIVNNLSNNEKRICSDALNKSIQYAYLMKRAWRVNVDMSCHYRKFGVPFDKLVYENKLF